MDVKGLQILVVEASKHGDFQTGNSNVGSNINEVVKAMFFILNDYPESREFSFKVSLWYLDSKFVIPSKTV